MEHSFETTYKNYWERKDLINQGSPRFGLIRWWDTAGMSPAESLIFAELKNSANLLDYGAGDLRLKGKFLNAGYSGDYKTLDFGSEFNYDYSDLAQIKSKFQGILFLDVIEHLHLDQGLQLLNKLLDNLSDQGVLVLQTPNARCIRNQKATDMTHLHIYNLKDLWAYATALGYEARGYRVVFDQPKKSLKQKVTGFFAKIVTLLVGCDYADNILLIIKKKD